MLNKALRIVSILLLFLAAVIPNSLPAATAAALVVAAILSLKKSRLSHQLAIVAKIYFLSVIVTIFYIIVGVINGAPNAAVSQVLIIYIASPLLWVLASNGILSSFSHESFKKLMAIIAQLSALSVALFYYLYLNLGSSAVEFFKQDANLNLNEGYAGATMHVYGPLIFLSSAFFSSPHIIKNKAARAFLLGSLAIAVITSGRSALILSLAVGFVIGLVIKANDLESISNRTGVNRRKVRYVARTAVTLLIFLVLLQYFSEIDLNRIGNYHLNELLSGGGSARTEQALALIDGINDKNGLGSGHGVGVSFIRSAVFPWRYELVWLATILRTGFVGAFIYSLVFIFYILAFLHRFLKRQIDQMDVFMFAGFTAAFIASNTNPYIEAVSMQWMYILPIVHLLRRRPTAAQQLRRG